MNLDWTGLDQIKVKPGLDVFFKPVLDQTRKIKTRTGGENRYWIKTRTGTGRDQTGPARTRTSLPISQARPKLINTSLPPQSRAVGSGSVEQHAALRALQLKLNSGCETLSAIKNAYYYVVNQWKPLCHQCTQKLKQKC